MKAKVVNAFPGRPDHEARTRAIEVDEIIEGELAAVAVREGWAIEVDLSAGDEISLDSVDLERLRIGDLKHHAATQCVDLGAAKTKAEIIAAITAAAKPKE